MNMMQEKFEVIETHLMGIAESILFAAGEAVSRNELARALEIGNDEVEVLMQALADRYRDSSSGLRLIQVNQTWQLASKPEYYNFIEKVIGAQENAGLSRAALETLSIIAYRQPITRIEIDNLRGVSSNSSVQRLLDRGLVKEAGRMEAPGRPILYKTTPVFLKLMQLTSVEDLPSFDRFSEERIEMPTVEKEA